MDTWHRKVEPNKTLTALSSFPYFAFLIIEKNLFVKLNDISFDFLSKEDYKISQDIRQLL